VTRCNSLGLSGNVLTVANQAAKAGGTLAGMWVLDVSDFRKVSTAKSLDDLKPVAPFLRVDPFAPRSPLLLLRGIVIS
jgi:hypothetical protein